MAAIDASDDAVSISAVVEFRKSAESLKSVTESIAEIDDVITSTQYIFAKCDDTLKEIYSQNEDSHDIETKLSQMQRSLSGQVADVVRIDEALKALTVAEKCMKLLKEIEAHYAEKDFYRLVVKVEQLRVELSSTPYHNTKVFTGIEQQTEKWRGVSSEWLGACLDQCITITSNDNSSSCSVDRHNLKNLFKEASFDLLANVFVLFSNQLLSSVIVPILRRSVTSINADTDVLVVNLEKDDLTDLPDRFDSGHESPTKAVIPAVISVFKFVKEHIFISVKNRKFFYDLVLKFGDHIVNDMSSLMCTVFLRPLLPNKPSKLGSFQHLVQQISELQKYLEETGFQQNPNKLLDEFVSSYVNIVLEKYETALLVEARDIMLLNWEDLSVVKASDPVASVSDSSALKKLPSRCLSDSLNESLFGSAHHGIFSLPNCKVSSLLIQFVGLVRQVLDEIRLLAKDTSDSGETDNAWLPGVLRYMGPCVRHVADMFLAFLPMATASLKCGSLQAAAIVLCDCSYYANVLLMLEIEFASIKAGLPSCRNALPMFIFLDMVQPARSHGWTVFRKAVDQMRSQLLEVDLDAWCQGAGGKLMASGFRLHCEQALTVVVSKLTHVTSSLRQVLPVTVASATLGLLIDAVLLSMVSQLISRVDISDAESRVHFEMLTRFSDELISKIGVLAASENEGSSPSPVIGKVYLSKLCPESWPRLLDMISLLDSDLASIVNRWADGAGPLATTFAADEVRSVVRALFQNSEIRQRALNSIK